MGESEFINRRSNNTMDKRKRTNGQTTIFPRITWFVTRLTQWVSLVEQELFTLPEHLSSSPVFSWVRVTRSFVLFVCFVDHCLSYFPFSFDHCVVCKSFLDLRHLIAHLICCFVLFFLAIVLSILLRFTDSDYPFSIFKLFLKQFTLFIYRYAVC